jgi:hypothetical protein
MSADLPGAARFAGTSLVGLLLTFPVWYVLSPFWTAVPSRMALSMMQALFPWADGLERVGSTVRLITDVQVLVMHGGHYRMGFLTSEVNTLAYGYGLVVFPVLLAAARTPRPVLKLVGGCTLLFVLQSTGICFHWLRDLAVVYGAETQGVLGFSSWQRELVVYGYQLAFLVLTPLAPVLIWSALDQRYLRHHWLSGVLVCQLTRR